MLIKTNPNGFDITKEAAKAFNIQAKLAYNAMAGPMAGVYNSGQGSRTPHNFRIPKSQVHEKLLETMFEGMRMDEAHKKEIDSQITNFVRGVTISTAGDCQERAFQASLVFTSKKTGPRACVQEDMWNLLLKGLARQRFKVAFFSCHPNMESTQVPGDTALSSLICQVLRWRPEILRDKDADSRGILTSSHHRSRDMLIDFLGAVLEMQDLQTIYLVVDRLDCCQPRIDNIVHEFARLITGLESPKLRIKVTIVAETSGGQGDWHWGFLLEHNYAVDRLFIVKQNQRRLTNFETSLPRRPSIWANTSAATV
ncbi:hypothetical protein B0T25DRAFT_569365 [Lasiosphaeria hispida]|uniref:Nephrocystin 3-like N-terminal domain-containing protein n=1 Tax=Lasiosphaeria hispida TaxID=260671 RepID=A0AAJ0HDP0_9PEZI|nr:hypothetical protein B0T25DRAFT_569365 [Lasiosphaeria hispida]